MSRRVDYYYFNPSGKWKYSGLGLPPSLKAFKLTHDLLFELNDNKMPGISGRGKEFTIVIIDSESWPRMIPAEINNDS